MSTSAFVPLSSRARAPTPLFAEVAEAEAEVAAEEEVAAPAPAPTGPPLAKMSTSLPFMVRPPKLDGSMAGDAAFDPLGLSEIDDVGFDLYWMREAEIKHARVAMLAAAGVIFVELFGTLPGFPAAEGRSQLDVFWDVWYDKPNLIFAWLIGFTMVELITGVAITKGRETGLRSPGDWGFNPMSIPVTATMAEKEIANGRLAMLASAGMILQGVTTHKPAFENVVDGFFSK